MLIAVQLALSCRATGITVSKLRCLIFRPSARRPSCVPLVSRLTSAAPVSMLLFARLAGFARLLAY